MQGIRSGQVQSEPNIVPLIDIMMVLMIIFMVLAAAQQEALFAQLVPEARNAQGPGEERVVLEIGTGGRYAINRQVVPRDSLAVRLRAIYAGRPDKTMLVRGDGAAPYQEIVTAIDIARGAGVAVVGLWTQRR
jgi:biopolymer transport protein TolR